MMIDLLYFASVREGIGLSGESLALPAGVDTLGRLLTYLRGRGGAYAGALSEEARIRAAINQAFASPDTPLAAGDEVALFPPITGG